MYAKEMLSWWRTCKNNWLILRDYENQTILFVTQGIHCLLFNAHFQTYRIDDTEGKFKVVFIYEMNAIYFIVNHCNDEAYIVNDEW